jgi:formate hydrogenlyase transcriptional activator
VITAQDGRLNLDRALPQTDIPNAQSTAPHDGITRVLTIRELEELERKNLVAALQVAQWRVSGETGAARLLGLNPSTLTSRMKALGITRPV